MTELAYLPDKEYKTDFSAKIVKRKGDYVVLDKTFFYPEGGGQPHDTGVLSWDGDEAKVVDVQKSKGKVRHFLDDQIPEDIEEIHGTIDWNRRKKHMRMHTAQHLISHIVLSEYGASTAGNQIHFDRSRIDFKPVSFDRSDIRSIEQKANKMISADHDVRKSYMSRDRIESAVEEGRTNLDLIPKKVDPLRVVEFNDDLCPCGGTHVDSLNEIGNIEITEWISKGADTERLEFELGNSN